MMFSSGWSHCC
ncbi:rCG47278 [Rattus norvegicus]|uniref:RCG47278 n=1 Tax=Rattus norvegicus TaxID=10116 RepID=A6I0N6_RAT|nr:rCG47278 [Rattus norvegicus]